MSDDASIADTRSLADALPREVERVAELLSEYDKLGPVGMFGAAMLRQALQRASNAMMSGDIVAQIKAYQELKDCQ